MWNVRDLLVLIRTTIIHAIKLADYKKLENTIETSDIYTQTKNDNKLNNMHAVTTNTIFEVKYNSFNPVHVRKIVPRPTVPPSLTSVHILTP
jgi:hypothetical protein